MQSEQYQKQPPRCFENSRFRGFTGKHLCWSLFLIKLQALQLYFKTSPTQVFFCKFWEIFKNTFFTEHLRTTAFECKVFVRKILVLIASEDFDKYICSYVQVYSYVPKRNHGNTLLTLNRTS